MREYWTELDGTNGLYDISNLGHIRNVHTRKNLKERKKTGGNQIIVSVNNKQFGNKKIFVANAVFKHFSQQEIKFKNFHVFHKDNNILNNSIENLCALPYVTKQATTEQLKIFNEFAFKNIHNFINKYYKIKGFDKENLEGDALYLVYKYLPDYDINASFFHFCIKYVKYAFYSNYKQFIEFTQFNDFQEKLL